MHWNRSNLPRHSDATGQHRVLQGVLNKSHCYHGVRSSHWRSTRFIFVKPKTVPTSYQPRMSHVTTRKSREVNPSPFKLTISQLSAISLHDKSNDDYVQDIYKHYQAVERPIDPYMAFQFRITGSIRSGLVSQLLEMSPSLGLCSETMFLMVDILDRYLSKTETPESYLFLTAVASLLVACKYEERYPTCPSLPDIVRLTDSSFSKQDLIEMETVLLQTLGYSITFPSPYSFLLRFAQGMTPEVTKLARVFLLQTLKSYGLRCQYRPSQLAAAAVYMSREQYLGNEYAWPTALASHCGLNSRQVVSVAQSVWTSPSFSLPKNIRISSPTYRTSFKRPASEMVRHQTNLPSPPLKRLRHDTS